MGATAVTELDALLDELGRRGFLMHAFRTDRNGPQVVALAYDWGGTGDVIILKAENNAVAFRAPNAPGIDIFDPPHVHWTYAGTAVWTARALLTLAPPGHPDAPTGLMAASGIGVPAERRTPVRIRPHGWH